MDSQSNEVGTQAILICSSAMNGKLTQSPAGANQWTPKDVAEKDLAPQVDGSGNSVKPIMTTADMAMRMDPAYEKNLTALPQEP